MILRPRGQIATFLLILTVGVLVFAMVTANLGRVATAATTITNAADSSALSLGSQLGSQANRIWNELGKKTGGDWQRTGFLGKLLAIIAAVIATIATWGQAWWTILYAATAGAVWGAIGEAIVQHGAGWRGALGGAIQGFGIGAGIASGAQAFSGINAATKALEAGLASGALDPTLALMPAFSTTGAVMGGSLAVGSTVGGGAYAQHSFSENLAQLAKGISGLGAADRIRESTFLEALSSTVEDPRKVQDLRDADGDGDTQEQISYFLDWWDRRVESLKAKADQAASGISGAIEQFTAGPLPKFIDDVNGFLQEVARKEVEGADGRVVELTRALTQAKPTPYQVPFWEPGPSKAELEAWASNPDAKPPQGFDELDGVIHELGAFLQDAALIDSQGAFKVQKPFVPYFPDFQDPLGPEERFVSRDLWIPLFYDPNSTTDYHDRLGVIAWGDTSQGVRGLTTWVKDLKGIRDKLPACSLDYAAGGLSIRQSNGSAAVPPCQIHAARRADLQQTIAETRFFITLVRSGQWEREIASEWEQQLAREGYTSPKVTEVVMTAVELEPSADRGVITSDYDFTFTYLDTEESPPKTKSETRKDNTQIFPIAGTGLRIGKTDALSAFEAGVDAFASFLNELEVPFAVMDAADLDDDFRPALKTIHEFKEAISVFRKALQTLPGATAPAGAQSVTYTWPDTLGEHSVQVDIDPFKVPRVEVEKKGNFFIGKQRLVLRDPSDNGAPPCVTVTRRDPANKDMGGMGLWTWSPMAGSDVSVITKRACVSYDIKKVELVGK